MKKIRQIVPVMLALNCLTLIAAPPSPPLASQQDKRPASNPQIDYRAFLKIAHETGPLREQRRLSEATFKEMAMEKGAIVLDARSADKYAMRHIKGALSLPFTDFTAEELARIIPGKTTRILIYCNNNFTGSPAAFASKSPAASLNISTFVSLATYGYTEVYELGPLLDLKTTSLAFEGLEVK